MRIDFSSHIYVSGPLRGEVSLIKENILCPYIWLENQNAPNFPSECPKPGVCIFVLNLLRKKKTFFSQMFLKIHPWGPDQANGSLQVCKKWSLLGVVLLTLLRTWRDKDVGMDCRISRDIKHQSEFCKVLLVTKTYSK